MLYEKGGYYDKAAAVYIRSKNWYVQQTLAVRLSLVRTTDTGCKTVTGTYNRHWL